MEQKTKISAEDNKQEIIITREFDLPVALLFKAHLEPDIVAQWMGTNVLILDAKRYGSYQFETTDPMGNKHCFSGTIHEFELNKKITRTFEMENTSFPVQLEFLHFEQITTETSKLTMQIIFKSVIDRNNLLKMPFAQGINMAHNQLQNIVSRLK